MKDIIKTVNRLVRTHETRNPFKIAKHEGFKIMYYDFDDIKGYYCKTLKRKFIVINQNLDELSQHIVCAHELGHGVMHNIVDTYFLKEYTLFPAHSKVETEAAFFSAELILDNNLEIASFYNDGRSLDEEVFENLIELKLKN